MSANLLFHSSPMVQDTVYAKPGVLSAGGYWDEEIGRSLSKGLFSPSPFALFPSLSQ